MSSSPTFRLIANAISIKLLGLGIEKIVKIIAQRAKQMVTIKEIWPSLFGMELSC
jgi:hypothetical protein